MPYKKKAAPGTNQFNELIDQLPEKKRKIHGQVQFRHDLLEPQKRINYHNEFDRLQGVKKLSGLNANTKSRMQELKKKRDSQMAHHLIVFILLSFNRNIIL